MELNVKINVGGDDHVWEVEKAIISEAARQMINEVLNNRYEKSGKTFRDKLHDRVKELLSENMDADFKESVKNDVVDTLSNKYKRTKQYKEIKEAFEIEEDSIIKTGLNAIISDIVKAEIKNCFK